jgi:hypothetical protein
MIPTNPATAKPWRIGIVKKYHEVKESYRERFDATIGGIPPMEDFEVGGASVKPFLPIFKMNFPQILDVALPSGRAPQPCLRGHQKELPTTTLFFLTARASRLLNQHQAES